MEDSAKRIRLEITEVQPELAPQATRSPGCCELGWLMAFAGLGLNVFLSTYWGLLGNKVILYIRVQKKKTIIVSHSMLSASKSYDFRFKY